MTYKNHSCDSRPSFAATKLTHQVDIDTGQPIALAIASSSGLKTHNQHISPFFFLTMNSLRTTSTRAVGPLLRGLSASRSHSTSSVSANELSHFSGLASSWWDPVGPSRILHLMNPLRHDFIASCLAESLPQPRTPTLNSQNPDTITTTTAAAAAANNLRYLDVGCGGGIFAESLARTIPSTPSAPATHTRAASITALDPSPTLIKIARDHARLDPTVDAHLRTGRFSYQNRTLEDLVAQVHAADAPAEQTFDIVTLFEVLEHVDSSAGSSPLTFLTDCLRLLRPGGWLIGSTIARTFPSFLVNQVIAEAPWPIGVVPRGTHEWSKFVNPDELEGWVQEGLMRARDGAAVRAGSEALRDMRWKCTGVMYFPGLGWKLVPGSESWGNYFWAVRKGV
ncbi:3-demethylubiquinone-9 3-methyltransferase [Aspergillus clavatus NRRL 1]|uniref:Ubiquinone biosynthesis O-methyltransferase, mitochondrial n=1 Tax=Aspergillus clavatus (strain ATCC 1007 / CBS 513.65 / DSM 816 / NCTC 3887 / NRRL 1 / QM 1276 / 107) TaxID=344612 RepID=A1CHY0_ASPCL|nr:3-demethylubiquinone-9 3-methyltransferase [Aspergillus clavatus NRRL 1]EAW10485.1 3-demethylubiquinone-9 3-methyltransferase [Aspergillus clavatus NRRL 1]